MNRFIPTPVAVLLLSLLLAGTAFASNRQSRYKRLAVDDFRIDESLERPWVMKVAGFCTLRFAVRTSQEDGRATARIASWQVSSGFHGPESVRIHPKKWNATAAEVARALAHEQGHLDINETHANLLRARKPSASGHGKTPAAAAADLKQKVDAILAEAARRCTEVQDRYDRETAHGTREKAQRSWEAQIAADLQQSRGSLRR
jgi:hypothetical protein